jgi:hypothetical protein
VLGALLGLHTLVGCGDDDDSRVALVDSTVPDDPSPTSAPAAVDTTAGTGTPETTPNESAPPDDTAPPDPPATGVPADDLAATAHGGVLVEEFGAIDGTPALGTPATVYADGTVIFHGPSPASDPGPSLPVFLEGHVSQERIDALLALADELGLLDEPAPPTPAPSGAGVAQLRRLVIHTADGELVHEQPAPWYDTTITTSIDHPSGTTQPEDVADYIASLTDEQVAARAAMNAFSDHLWGQEFAGTTSTDGQQYVPTALAVLVLDEIPDPERDLQTVAWPLDADLGTAGEPIAGRGMRCIPVTGADLATLLPVAEEAWTPRWVQDGTTYHLGLRVVLPHELPCRFDR